MPNHGHSYYNHAKCRCEICRAAQRDYGRKRRKADPKKIAETLKAWRIRNREHLLEYDRKRYSQNKEYFAEHNKQWMKDHKQERLASNKAWRQAHPEQVKESKRKEYRKHRDKYKARAIAWRARNSEHENQRKRAYHKTEKGRLVRRTTKNNRRAAKGHTSPEQFKMRWEYYGGLCWMCHQPATEMDHVIPLGRRGTNWPANLRPACRTCNAKKGKQIVHGI